MKKLVLLSTAAVMVMAMAQPGFAASRVNRAAPLDAAGRANTDAYTPYDAYASGAYTGGVQYQVAPSYSFGSTVDDLGRGRPLYGAGPNLPYPDRPYGAPDRD